MSAPASFDAAEPVCASSFAPAEAPSGRPFAGPPVEGVVSHAERRRHERVAVQLSGRYMLADGSEFPCRTVDVSPGGVALIGHRSGEVGERIVAYIAELGRIEGHVVRRAANLFAAEIRASGPKLERLRRRIEWLARRAAEGLAERRCEERLESPQEEPTLLSVDKTPHYARLVDLSSAGAALLVDVAPPIGAPIVIGARTGTVARHFPGGIAVRFHDVDPPDGSLDAGARARAAHDLAAARNSGFRAR